MRKNIAWRGVFALANMAVVFALTACASPQNNYVPPATLTPATGATIIGSNVINPDPLAPNTRVVLYKVDNLDTQFKSTDWKTPLLVTPGIHLLTFGPCYCGGLEAYSGSATLYGNFQAGKTYTLMSTRAKGFLSWWSSTIWIADASGAVFAPKTLVQLGPPGGTTVMPIFIPIRH